MPNNSTDIAIPTASVRSRRADMECFDRLPKRLRDLLNYAPAPIAALSAEPGLKTVGVKRIEKDFWRMFAEAVPEWTPLSSEPIGRTGKRRARA